jgi:hypothetical protein
MSAFNKNTEHSKHGRDSRAVWLRVVTFIGGLYFFLYFITPEWLIEQAAVKQAHESISNGCIAVGSMAIGLGIINILTSHGARVIFLKKGWQYSLALLAGMFVMIGVTIAQWRTTYGVSADIRRVQVISDFATRIIEDAKAEPGKARSHAPQGALPPLADRIAALVGYAEKTLDQVSAAGLSLASGAYGEQLFGQLRDECEQGVGSLRSTLKQVGFHTWNGLDATGEQMLVEIAQQAARVGSTYAILKRKESTGWLSSRLYDFLYNGLFNHLGASMFALLGVYIAAAAYRAFRIQSVESALLMIAALIVMLGQISFGKMLYSDMPAIRQWLLEVPNSAAFRAIRLGAGVAGLMLAIRMWLSIESVKRKGKQ